jgi:hypothetical protein
MPILVAATTSPNDWLYVAMPFLIYGLIVVNLAIFGEHGDQRNPLLVFFTRIGHSLRQLTGMPGWSMAGALTGLNVLAVAAIGLYWDVAWHFDNGRDDELFTQAHTMILLGLGGLVFAAVVAVVYATIERADVGFRVAGVQVPWSALALGLLGLGGAAAFPLDDLWHQAYGVDVTLWSPTHLQLVAGGGLGPVAVWLMIREGRTAGGRPNAFAKVIEAVSLGAVLVGLSAFQGEFDFGMPQFQMLYLPVLLAAAAGMGLVMARIALGRGGALAAAGAFIVLRLVFGLLVGGALNHTFPRFPLYVVAALAVEAVALALGTDRRFRFALAAGFAAGTVGVAGDLAWVEVSGWFDIPSSVLVKGLLLGAVAGVGAAVLGAGLARAASPRGRIPAAASAAAVLALVGAFAYPFPRNVGRVDAVIRLEPVGERANVTVEMVPADAAVDATAFGIVAWQGGGTLRAPLEQVAPGRYVSSVPVPVTGTWKTMVGLQRGDEVMAAPIYLPADPEIGAGEIPAVSERREAFVRNTDLLLREAKDGPTWPALAAYAGFAVVASTWFALLALAATRIAPTPAAVGAGPGVAGGAARPVSSSRPLTGSRRP